MPTRQSLQKQVSAELLEAQERLLERRRQLSSRPRPSAPAPPLNEASEQEVSWLLRNAQKELEQRRQLAGTAPTSKSAGVNWPTQAQASQTTTPPQPTKKPETVTVYPSILLAILKQDLAAAGRVYLLLRYLDIAGRGCLSVEKVRNQLTKNSSPIKVMGWRRLRQIFHLGEGVFWERDNQDRIWLKSAAKIALELDCHRLKGKRVELPITSLLGGISRVRAHFYASFLSGRSSDNPISRDTLADVTGVSPRTQRDYDQKAKVKRQQNIAVGPKRTKISAEEQSWQRGGAVFSFVDTQGKQGPKNREYLAWHLPNSYQAPHQQRPTKGRQKKINQQLVSLVNNGVQGNDQAEVETLFWPDGAAAGKAYNRDPRVDAYWPRGKARVRSGVIWYALAAEVQ